MLRLLFRFGGVAGLAVVALALTGGALALTDRARAAPVIGQKNERQAASLAPDFTIALVGIVPTGLSRPVGIANAGDGSGRLFVVEQEGYIRIIKNGDLLPTPYLAVSDQVVCCSERGLLGLEFDPDFESNGTFYLNYTTNAQGFSGDTVVARYQVANPAADTASVITVTNIITIDQPESNHNGGDLHFSPINGYLYIGMGDGGGGGDQHGPIGNGQAPTTLLGKMLRINVRGVPTYTIPPTNPFTRTAGYKPEIWALGLRNPWRFSFDRATGDLYIGDVGQNCWEEIDYQPASSHGGENYGWRIMEGFRPFNLFNFDDCLQPPTTPPTITLPITAYGRSLGSAVTGGFVYRGQQYPWMRGVYFYSDSGSRRIWTAQQTAPGVWVTAQELDSSSSVNVTAFGEDENGELYVTKYASAGSGGIYKITSPSPINLSGSRKQVSSSVATPGETVTYTIVLSNSGQPFYETVRVTDTLPTGLAYVSDSLTATLGTVEATAPVLKWNGVMSSTRLVTITFRALITAQTGQIITNAATIDPLINPPLIRTAPLTVKAVNLSTSQKWSSTVKARFGDRVTYTLALRNTGDPFTPTIRITDTLPSGLSYRSGTLTATLGSVDDSAAPVLKWSGILSDVGVITVTYVVTVSTPSAAALLNSAVVDAGTLPPFTRSTVVIANPFEVFLPLVMRNN
jgi:uncharacterized repeat protein (TIGR01451 family)